MNHRLLLLAIAVAAARRLRRRAGRRPRAHPPQGSRRPRAAHRAGADEPEPARARASASTRCRPTCAASAAKSSCCRTRARVARTSRARCTAISRSGSRRWRRWAASGRAACHPAGWCRASRRRPRRGEQPSYDAAFNALKGADYPKAINGFRTFVAIVPVEPAREQRAVLARRGVLRDARLPERDHGFPEGHHRLAGFAQGARRAREDRLHAGGAGQATATRASRWRRSSQRYPGSEAAQLASERLKRLPAK